MSFGPNRSSFQNYGNKKSSKREQLIAHSRAKRQERKKKKKRENAVQIIQKWYRMNASYNTTTQHCKSLFNEAITSLLQKSQKSNANTNPLTFHSFTHLLHLFKISLFGFTQTPNQWKISPKFLSQNHKFFSISVRRLYSLFLILLKKGTNLSEIITNDSNAPIQFQFLVTILTAYLQLPNIGLSEQQSLIMCIWSIVDCNKWKHFESISKTQQNQSQRVCHKLLRYLFIQTPFLSVMQSILTQHMPLPVTNANNTKTILALSHTIIIRYFQFSKISKNKAEMDCDKEQKMSEDESDKKLGNNNEDSVIALVSLKILSIPYYIHRLRAYKLESVIKSFISDNIWTVLLRGLNEYCINAYNRCIFVQKHKHKKDNDLWQESVSCSEVFSNTEKKENNDSVMDVMDYADYDDHEDSDSDSETVMNDNVKPLQTFLNITEETQTQTNESEKVRYIRKKRRNKRKIKRKMKHEIITELPAIVWTIHNILDLYCDYKKFESKTVKTFVSFLNIAQITFNLLDFITPIHCGYHSAFPFNNAHCEYSHYYLASFNKWIGLDILHRINSAINNGVLSLSEYSIITKFLRFIIGHFPGNKEHFIWSNLGLKSIDHKCDKTNIIIALYENVCLKYNICESKDWANIIKQYLNGISALANAKKNKMSEYNSSVLQCEESTKCMQIFELLCIGINYYLRIIDDEQLSKDHIPFTPKQWITFIQTFKYVCYVSYWKHYAFFNRFQSYFKRSHKHKNKNKSKPMHLLEIYSDTFDAFVSSIMAVFACLRDRNSRKQFISDAKIWLMDTYIDMPTFESEILNVSVSSETEFKQNTDNDIPMANNNNSNAFPPAFNDQFNPFSNREFGYDSMYGGIMHQNNDTNIANQSQENLQRFEDNFNINNKDFDTPNHSNNFKRSFLILISIPFVIPFKLRVKLFYKLIEFEKDKLESEGHSIRINRGNAIRARIRRGHTLDDGYRGLNRYSNELKTLIQIEFENKYGEIEAGIDGGGIFKEFLNELIKDAFDPQRGLFLETEYGKELYPNPNYFVFKQLMNIDKDYYQFLGKMLAKAIYDRQLIEPIFSNFFLRKLLGLHNYIDDLQSYDIDLYKQLMALKHDFENNSKIETMELSFSTTQNVLGSQQSYDLIHNGSDVLVTHENRHKYINILADYKLNKSMYEQSLAFLKGMSAVINLDYLRIFDASELSKLLSGNNNESDWTHSWSDLRKNTVYSGGFHNQHRLIKWFWEILNTDLSHEDNQRFLMFVTSCTRSPLLGFKSLNPLFSVMCTGGDTNSLPTSQTCMNLLKVPNYPTKEKLKEKLFQSIRSNAGFDLS